MNRNGGLHHRWKLALHASSCTAVRLWRHGGRGRKRPESDDRQSPALLLKKVHLPISAAGVGSFLELCAAGRDHLSQACSGIIAENSAQFTNYVIHLLENRTLRDRLAIAARKLIAEEYIWHVIGVRLAEVYAIVRTQDASQVPPTDTNFGESQPG